MEIKDTLKYFKFCFQKRNDQRFIKNIYRIENDDSLANIQKMDGEKEGIRCYYIAPDASGSGFFADHNRLLSYLYYADCVLWLNMEADTVMQKKNLWME